MDKYISAKLDSFNFSKSQKELFVDIIAYVAAKVVAGGIDLNNFVTKNDLHNSVHGLELDINTVRDTAVEANRIANNNIDEINNINDNIIPNFYTKTQTNTNINTAIQNLIGTAPEALDTLGEIAEKLNNNDNTVAAITNQITELNTKVNSKADVADVSNLNTEITNINNKIEKYHPDNPEL